MDVNVDETQSNDNRVSSLWDYMTKEEDEKAKCNLCSVILSRQNSATSGLRKHLFQVHRVEPFGVPRSTVTDSIYGRKRSYTVSYTTVYMSYTLRIRPYFAGIHVIVLRSYITVTVYGDIRRKTEIVYEALRS
jgi:hypothetical protein